MNRIRACSRCEKIADCSYLAPMSMMAGARVPWPEMADRFGICRACQVGLHSSVSCIEKKTEKAKKVAKQVCRAPSGWMAELSDSYQSREMFTAILDDLLSA